MYFVFVNGVYFGKGNETEITEYLDYIVNIAKRYKRENIKVINAENGELYE